MARCGIPLVGERDKTLGDLVLHIFGPELRYVERIRGEPLTEYRGLPPQTGHNHYSNSAV